MPTTTPVKITLDTAHGFAVIKNEKGEYIIEKTKENIFDWYKNNFTTWFLSYPGYSMWTAANYESVTLGVLDNLQKVVKKNFDIPIRSVKDFCDIVNKERLALAKR